MAQRMGQSQMSSQQMAEMMKQMRQAAGGNQSSQLEKSMQNFSQMLSGMDKAKQQSQLASSSLGAMQMMKSGMNGMGMQKSGMGSGDQSGKLGAGPGRGESNPEQKEGLGIGTDSAEKIFGDRKKIETQRTAAKVEGEMSQGQNFENVLRGAAETTTSTVEYRELFNNYTPEAEESIFKESIPLGSKYYINRYFEGIRPQE